MAVNEHACVCICWESTQVQFPWGPFQVSRINILDLSLCVLPSSLGDCGVDQSLRSSAIKHHFYRKMCCKLQMNHLEISIQRRPIISVGSAGLMKRKENTFFK